MSGIGRIKMYDFILYIFENNGNSVLNYVIKSDFDICHQYIFNFTYLVHIFLEMPLEASRGTKGEKGLISTTQIFILYLKRKRTV